jgi:hypothetical protein
MINTNSYWIFIMKINDIFESTTSGSVASVAMPMGGTQKREGTLFKGKKTKKKFYESEVSEAEVNEADLILVPGQGKKLKPGFIPKDQDRRDHEVEMARSDLFHAAQNAKEIYKMIHQVSEDEGLEGWVQEKIIKANDYLNTVREYLEHKTYMQEGGVIAGGMSNFEEGVAEGSLNEMDKSQPSSSRGAEGLPLGKKADPVKTDKVKSDALKVLQKQYKKQGVAEEQAPMFTPEDEQLDEKKDACYSKVKSRYKVWPSAYASGALVKCRKVGASNWGNKSKK